MQQQAEGLGIPLSDLQLDDIDFQILAGSQRRIEGEEDFIPRREVALRLSGLVEAATFQIAEMAFVLQLWSVHVQ
jgi:hypothetical protein